MLHKMWLHQMVQQLYLHQFTFSNIWHMFTPRVYINSPVTFSSQCVLVLLHFNVLCYYSFTPLFYWKYWTTCGTFYCIVVIMNGMERNRNSFLLICWSDTLLWTHYMTNVIQQNKKICFHQCEIWGSHSGDKEGNSSGMWCCVAQ
jgi:hypothetical protein